MSDLKLDVEQAAELKHAFRRGNWTNEEIKKLCKGNILTQVREVVLGKSEVAKIVPKWIEKDGVIYFYVISDGTSGSGWIKRLESQQCDVSRVPTAKGLLESEDFKSTCDIVYRIALIRGTVLDRKYGRDLRAKHILAERQERGFANLSPEIGCLIREKFSEEDFKAMDIHGIIPTHDPVVVGHFSAILSVPKRAYGHNAEHLDAVCGLPDTGRFDGYGYAFLASASQWHSTYGWPV